MAYIILYTVIIIYNTIYCKTLKQYKAFCIQKFLHRNSQKKAVIQVETFFMQSSIQTAKLLNKCKCRFYCRLCVNCNILYIMHFKCILHYETQTTHTDTT